MPTRFRRSLVLIALVLSACAAPPPPPASDERAEQDSPSGFCKLLGPFGSVLTACSAPPPPPPSTLPTTVELSIAGGADMNGGLPAKVKVYYLASTSRFSSADFFAVFGEPEATLGADLVSVEEYQLVPGATVADAKSFDTAPVAIGVVAAFREIGRPGWRAVGPLVPNAENPVEVTLAANTVAIGQ